MLNVELLQLKDKNPLVLSVASGDFFRLICKKRGQCIKKEGMR